MGVLMLCAGCRPELGRRYDGDGDGLTEAQGDCDDTNPEVHRGVFERPFDGDGLDQNCDGYDFCTDFNCDGWPDILLPGVDSATEWMAGGPDRRWTLGGVLPGPRYANLPAAGDLNRDGYLDIVLPNWPGDYSTEPAQIFWGVGEGFSETSTSIGGLPFRAARIGDADQDGYADLLLVTHAQGTELVAGSMLTWGPIAPSVFPFTFTGSLELPGGCSSDGVFVPLEDASSLALVLTSTDCGLGPGFRLFERPADNPYYSDQPGACSPIALSTGDYNGDGRQDLSLGCWEPDGPVGELWFGEPGRGFVQQARVVDRDGVTGAPYNGSADLDGDGDTDWAWGLYDGVQAIGVGLYENVGDEVPVPIAEVDSEAWQFALADLDLDDRVDLILSVERDGTRVYWGGGDWTWTPSSAPLTSVEHATPVVCPGGERCYLPPR